MTSDVKNLTADTRVSWTGTAISTAVDDELVALDVTKGICYGLNRVGTRIWQLIETPRSAREVAEIIVNEFDVSPDVCLGETLALLQELAAAELVH